jgi:hypothetical protein
MAGTAAWLLAKASDPSVEEVGRLAEVHFSKHLSAGYPERFQAHPSSPRKGGPGSTVERDELLEQAFIESKSALRRIVVGTSVKGTFHEDADFDADPVFAAAASALDSLELELTGLDKFSLARCPQCGLVGELETWFGWRTTGGKTIRQSWCRICRSSKSPSRL